MLQKPDALHQKREALPSRREVSPQTVQALPLQIKRCLYGWALGAPWTLWAVRLWIPWDPWHPLSPLWANVPLSEATALIRVWDYLAMSILFCLDFPPMAVTLETFPGWAWLGMAWIGLS